MLTRAVRKVRFEAKRRRTERKNHRTVSSLASAGQGIRFTGDWYVTGVDQMIVGDNVHIGSGAFIRAEGGLRIGSNTHISRNLVLYTMNHQFEGEALPYDHRQSFRPVEIGRNVWIGMNVCIVPGSRIGDGAIVGMGSVVSGEVPPMSIVASQPVRIIGHRDSDRYEELDRLGRYGGSGGRLLPPVGRSE